MQSQSAFCVQRIHTAKVNKFSRKVLFWIAKLNMDASGAANEQTICMCGSNVPSPVVTKAETVPDIVPEKVIFGFEFC